MTYRSRGRWWTAVFLLASALALAWVAKRLPEQTASAQPPAGDLPAGVLSEPAAQPQQMAAEAVPAQPPPSAQPARPGQPPQAVRAQAEPYDFSQPAPASEAVDNSYFADAAFVGDSRTDGFYLYSGVGCGRSLTSNGLSIFQLAEKKALTIGGQKYTLLEALAMEEYGKVYLSLGVNELGYYNDEGFYRSYCQAIDAIRALQPNAVIYIQALIPINEQVIANTTGRTYLDSDHLRVYNDLMRRAAQEKQVVFVDLYSHFADEDGELPAEASKDGVHLTKDYCRQWLAYLQTHTVKFDVLYPNGPPAEQPREGEAPVEEPLAEDAFVEEAGQGAQTEDRSEEQ